MDDVVLGRPPSDTSDVCTYSDFFPLEWTEERQTEKKRFREILSHKKQKKSQQTMSETQK